MQYSLKTLMIAAGVLALLAALTSKFGGHGLLGGLVVLLVSIILYCFTQLPLRHAVANSLLIGAIALHVALIYFFFPVAADWANDALSAAADRGYEIQRDEYEMHEFSMQFFVIVFGYLPSIVVIFARVGLLDVYKANGAIRLVLSLWLLILPFFAAWFEVNQYRSF